MTAASGDRAALAANLRAVGRHCRRRGDTMDADCCDDAAFALTERLGPQPGDGEPVRNSGAYVVVPRHLASLKGHKRPGAGIRGLRRNRLRGRRYVLLAVIVPAEQPQRKRLVIHWFLRPATP